MKILNENVSTLFFIGIAIFVLLYVQSLPAGTGGDPGSALFPTVIASLILFFGFFKLSIDFLVMKKSNNNDGSEKKISKKMMVLSIIFFFVTILFASVFEYLGVYLSVFLFLFVSFFILGKRCCSSLFKYIALSLIFSFSIYFIFDVLFSIPLPTGDFL